MFECQNRDCPYWAEGKRLVRPEGRLDSEILIIGEAPGADEDRLGRPFIGRSGQLLREELQKAGFDVAECLITNVVWCRPPENEDPPEKIIKQCRKTYETEWERLLKGRKLVMLFGKVASGSIQDEKKRGKVSSKDGQVMMSLYHPAYLLRSPLEIHQFREDLVLAKSLVDRNEDVSEIDFSLVNTQIKLRVLAEELEKIDVFSFDLETKGRNPFAEDARIVMISISTPITTYVIPLDKFTVGWDDIKRIFSSPARKIAQNGKYDILWLMSRGVEVKNFWFDTMIAQFLLNAREYEAIGLKQLVWQYFPEYGGYSEEIDFEEMSIEDIDFDKLVKYAALDAFLCRKIAGIQLELMREDGLDKVYFKVLADATNSIASLEFNGFKTDLEFVSKLAEDFKGREEYLDKKIRSELPLSEQEKANFNLGSTKQVKELLFKKMGLPVFKKTEKGGDSVDKEVLQELAKLGNTFCNDLLELRKYEKLRGTYLDAFYDRASRDSQHLVRCEYNLGTRGGRLSSSNPNMQNLPKEMRDCFISRFDNGLLVEGDFKQMELRICALYSKDEAMIKMLNDGVDIHKVTIAQAVSLGSGLNIKPEDVTDEQRKRGKALNFGLIYGRQPQSLADEFKITQAEAQEFYDGFFNLFPKVKAFHKKTRDLMGRTGYAFSLLGRRRFLGDYEPHEAATRAVNFPIQSLASDVCVYVLNKLWRTFLENEMRSVIVATVHDSIVIDTPEEEAEQVIELFSLAVENVDLFDEPLPFKFEVEISIGERWGSLEGI